MKDALLGMSPQLLSEVIRKVGSRYVLILAVVLAATPLCADDWPQFRGPNSAGIGTGSPPIHFGPESNVLWSTTVAPGHSSPCIHDNRIFIITFNNDSATLSVECFDRQTGQNLWVTPFPVKTFEKGHPSFNPASSSPCCDHEHVIAYFGSYGLACLDHNGVLKWEQRLPLAKSFGGNATSPIIY